MGGVTVAEAVTLDAMIRRADFATGAEENVLTDQISSLSIESLGPSSMIIPMLRKPDFQRETNHWTPQQLVNFLESFLDNELIPSIILWKSPAYVFVIDGGHRLSALRAWIEDDYGDGTVSRKFFDNEITQAQRKTAARTRKTVEDRVGSYSRIKAALLSPEVHSPLEVIRARNMATRSLSLQWVMGDTEKAETSFFKINTQGTPLDKTEELLLRNRKRPVAIAARSMLRAATGHKYWSSFESGKAQEIEAWSKKLHELIFKPEITEPIKTLSLPVGGRTSPVAAIELLIRLITITNASQAQPRPEIEQFPEDMDGAATVEVMKRCFRVVERLTGDSPCSLGLHPAVYFYTDNGQHSAYMLLGLARLFALRLAHNDDDFFARFASARESIEKFLCEQKPVIAVLINAVTSRQRVDRIQEFFEAMIRRANEGQALDTSWAIDTIAPNSRAKVLLMTEGEPSKFTQDTKSAIYLKEALGGAMKCPICMGFLEPSSSVSYDHIQRVRDGGFGTPDNGQLTHPYCNTGVKG